MNGTGNVEDISAETVPAGRLGAQLVAKRKLFGAETPAGHRCSNLTELLDSRKKAVNEQQIKNIEDSMARQAADLGRLSQDAPLKRNITDLSLERLREVLDYDPKTGALTWRFRTSPKCRLDEPAGAVGSHGYRKIRLDDRYYTASHLAWFHFYGMPPVGLIDHASGDKTDDRIENLRLATPSQNAQNIGVRRSSSTGLKGAARFNSPRNSKKFRSTITINKKRIHLGQFDTAEEAHEAYCKAAKELHGEFARTS